MTDPDALRRAGRRVTQYRRDHKLTLRAFAERAHVSIGVVQTFEAGTRTPNGRTLAKLARGAGYADVAAFVAEGPETVPGSDLGPDAYEVAQIYARADWSTKVRVREILHAAGLAKGTGAPSSGAPFPERRAGRDRRRANAPGIEWLNGTDAK